MKSFQPQDAPEDDQQDANGFKPRHPDVDFPGQTRSNETHASRTDGQAKLYRKGPGKPAQLAYWGHLLNENRHGLILEIAVTEANGAAEKDAALEMIDRYRSKHGRGPQTHGADAGYDAGEFLMALEQRAIEPHVAMTSREPASLETARERSQGEDRKEKIAARQRKRDRQQSVGYTISQCVRKRIEECFGWLKTIAGMARSRWVGRAKLKQYFELTAAASNLVRMTQLRPTGPPHETKATNDRLQQFTAQLNRPDSHADQRPPTLHNSKKTRAPTEANVHSNTLAAAC